MRLFLTACLSAIAFASLTGCGQMGPLYMPTPEETAKTAPVAKTEQQQPKADAP